MSAAKEANLHELAREALACARIAHPAPLADVEHRGDGDCVVETAAIVDLLACVLGIGFAALAADESLWMRSSATDPEMLAVFVRWRGADPDPAQLATARAAAAAAGAELLVEPEGDERHVAVRFARAP